MYCQTASEVEEATVELLDKIKAMSSASSKVPLGFDVEWKPSSVKGWFVLYSFVPPLMMGVNTVSV